MQSNLLYIEDMGYNEVTEKQEGRQIAYNDDGSIYIPSGSETLEVLASDPVSFFHNDTPPFKQGRIYAGKKIIGAPNFYVVHLPAKGDTARNFIQSSGGSVFFFTGRWTG